MGPGIQAPRRFHDRGPHPFDILGMNRIQKFRGIRHDLFGAYTEKIDQPGAEERIADLAFRRQLPLIDDAGHVVGDGMEAALAFGHALLELPAALLLDQ